MCVEVVHTRVRKGVVAGYWHSCGIRGGDGHPICWGSDNNNWHSSPTDEGAATPPVPGVGVVAISAGIAFSMALRSDNGKPRLG